jgi:hypothetical protein
MTKKFSVLAVLSALWLGFGTVSAQAQVPAVKSQTLYYSGTCTGTDEVTSKPFSPTVTGTVIGGDILLFQPPTSGITYAFAGIAGSTNLILWAGPGDKHVTSFPGNAGFGLPAATYIVLWLIQMVQGRGRAWLGSFRRIWSRRRVWGWHCALQGKR